MSAANSPPTSARQSSVSGALSASPSPRDAAPTASAPKASPLSASASSPVAGVSTPASASSSMTPSKLYPAMVDLMKNKVLFYFQQCQTSAKPSNDHKILYDLMARLYMEIERVYPMPSSNPTPAAIPGLGPLPSLPANGPGGPSASSVSTPSSSAPGAAKEKEKDVNVGLAGGAVSALEMRRSSLTRLQSAPAASSRSSISVSASAASPSGAAGRPSEANPFVLTPAHFRKYDWQDEQCRTAYENATLLSQLLTEGEPDESTHLSDIVMECVGSLREVTIKVSKRLMTAEEKDEKIIRELISAQEAAQAVLTHHYKLLNHILSPGSPLKLPSPPVTAMTNDDGTRRQHPLFYSQPHALKSVKLRDVDREKKSEGEGKTENGAPGAPGADKKQ